MMMQEKMSAMFGEMGMEERLTFVRTMFPQCLGVIFRDLDQDTREDIVGGMVNHLRSCMGESAPAKDDAEK